MAAKKKRIPDRLEGKNLAFQGSMSRRRTRVGYYLGKIHRVSRTKRRGISRVTVKRVDGSKVCLHPEEWQGEMCGVYWFGRFRPLAEVDAVLAAKEVKP